MTSPRFVDTGGRLPNFWGRQVTFFANLLGLFFGNTAQTECLAKEVGEIDSYGGRLLPILNVLFQNNENVLVLEREPDAALCRYLREDVGLSLPRWHFMRHRDYLTVGKHLEASRVDEAKRLLPSDVTHSTPWIDGYVTDEILVRISQALGSRTICDTQASRDGNNKLLLHRYISRHGLPTPETVEADSPGDVPRCVQHLAERGYRASVIRSQIGASGIGMVRIADNLSPGEWPELPEHLFFEGPCLVQGWMEPGIHGIQEIRSPSIQLFLDDQTVFAYDMTEQILSHESVHEGNESPIEYLPSHPGLREEMMRQAEIAGTWLHDTGYRGTASIDFLLVRREDRPTWEVFICEINARVTGATYPSVLARRFFPEGAWVHRNLRLREPLAGDDLIAMFRKPGHLFVPGKTGGVLPINFNFGADGRIHKGQFLCLGQSPRQCHEYLHLAQQDLPIEWSSDRD